MLHIQISLLCALGKVNMSVLERTDFSKGEFCVCHILIR